MSVYASKRISPPLKALSKYLVKWMLSVSSPNIFQELLGYRKQNFPETGNSAKVYDLP